MGAGSSSSQVSHTCTTEYPTGPQQTWHIHVKDTQMGYTPGNPLLKTHLTTKSQYDLITILNQQFNVNGTLTYTVNNQKHTEALTSNHFSVGFSDNELSVYLHTSVSTPVTLNISLFTASITYAIKHQQTTCASS